MKRLAVIIIVHLLFHKAIAQENNPTLTLSPFVDTNVLFLSGNGFVYNTDPKGNLYKKYWVEFGGNLMQGYRLGVLATHHLVNRNFYYRLGFFHNVGWATIDNLHPEEEMPFGPTWTGFFVPYTFNRLECAVKTRMYKIRKVDFLLGLQVFRQFKESAAWMSDDYFDNPNFPLRKQEKILSRVSDCYLPFGVAIDYSINCRFGPLLLGLTVEKSLSPISREITFNNVPSRLVQKFGILSLSVSYEILKFRKKPNI